MTVIPPMCGKCGKPIEGSKVPVVIANEGILDTYESGHHAISYTGYANQKHYHRECFNE